MGLGPQLGAPTGSQFYLRGRTVPVRVTCLHQSDHLLKEYPAVGSVFSLRTGHCVRLMNVGYTV